MAIIRTPITPDDSGILDYWIGGMGAITDFCTNVQKQGWVSEKQRAVIISMHEGAMKKRKHCSGYDGRSQADAYEDGEPGWYELGVSP